MDDEDDFFYKHDSLLPYKAEAGRRGEWIDLAQRRAPKPSLLARVNRLRTSTSVGCGVAKLGFGAYGIRGSTTAIGCAWR